MAAAAINSQTAATAHTLGFATEPCRPNPERHCVTELPDSCQRLTRKMRELVGVIDAAAKADHRLVSVIAASAAVPGRQPQAHACVGR